MREVLPQVTLLRHAALAVSHGGNNSVTEALTAGVPLLLLPLSTDQFAGAAALEDAGLARRSTRMRCRTAEIREVRSPPARIFAGEPRDRLAALAAELAERPGRVPEPGPPLRDTP